MSTDYKVVKSSSTFLLECEVKRLIEQGYAPVGSMSNSSTSDFLGLYVETEYCQAMIKEDE